MDTGEYSSEYTREAWSYLGGVVMIDTDFAGLVHYPDQNALDDEGVLLIARKST